MLDNGAIAGQCAFQYNILNKVFLNRNYLSLCFKAFGNRNDMFRPVHIYSTIMVCFVIDQ